MYLHPLIAQLPPAGRAALVQCSELRAYRRNETLLAADDWSSSAYRVVSGLFRVVVRESGDSGVTTTSFARTTFSRPFLQRRPLPVDPRPRRRRAFVGVPHARRGAVGADSYDKRVTQSVIASYSGLSREAVNKTMRDLKSRGLVRGDAGDVHVCADMASTDFARIEAMAPMPA